MKLIEFRQLAFGGEITIYMMGQQAGGAEVYTALVTLPALRHLVHTQARNFLPWYTMRIFCRFGLKVRLVRFLA